ncbi:MAG: hypothetical protein QOC81_505 [Thermoanaerobaculia bacterium]|nr:hypothetical protein [Thermoanaerobaculia bacterium]
MSSKGHTSPATDNAVLRDIAITDTPVGEAVEATTSGKTYHIEIVGDGNLVRRDISLQMAGKVLSELFEDELAASRLPTFQKVPRPKRPDLDEIADELRILLRDMSIPTQKGLIVAALYAARRKKRRPPEKSYRGLDLQYILERVGRLPKNFTRARDDEEGLGWVVRTTVGLIQMTDAGAKAVGEGIRNGTLGPASRSYPRYAAS